MTDLLWRSCIWQWPLSPLESQQRFERHVPDQTASPRPVPLRRSDRHRHGSRRGPPQASSRRRRHLRHRPQHQLHEFLHRVLHLLRFLPAAEGTRSQRGLHPRVRNHLRQDPRDRRAGRHRRADAGRPASRSEDRVAREDAERHQAALSQDSSALLFGVGNHRHRRVQRS